MIVRRSASRQDARLQVALSARSCGNEQARGWEIRLEDYENIN